MTRDTYHRARAALTLWDAEKGGLWPDSRDPEFQNYLFQSGVTPQDYEKAAVCHICALLSTGQPYAVSAALALVVMNRTEEDASPYQTAAEMLHPTTALPDNLDALDRLLHNVEALFNRELYDPTNGSTTFTDIRDLSPGAISTPSRVSIGNFLFT